MPNRTRIENRAISGLTLDAADLARVSRDRRVITLRRAWMSAEGMDARVWDGIRSAVYRLAREIADATSRSVEIYAAGGYMIEQISPSEA